jgi:hypothetical protein
MLKCDSVKRTENYKEQDFDIESKNVTEGTKSDKKRINRSKKIRNSRRSGIIESSSEDELPKPSRTNDKTHENVLAKSKRKYSFIDSSKSLKRDTNGFDSISYNFKPEILIAADETYALSGKYQPTIEVADLIKRREILRENPNSSVIVEVFGTANSWAILSKESFILGNIAVGNEVFLSLSLI